MMHLEILKARLFLIHQSERESRSVGSLVNTDDSFGSISKHERKSAGDYIRKMVDVDQEKNGAQNTSLGHSRQDREKV